ncbi:MAG TPA: hypothetical protein VHY32_04000 [Caulobacteraceae bacterium]|jgi:hypothetical protein|nr:hypothetical protein [Caulobacteraceae bacterium]
MAHFKLSDQDDNFLQVPQDAVLVFAGASGTETFIERDRDVTVRIVVKAVGVAMADDGVLEVAIELGDARARGQDGPFPNESTLRASQSVQVVVKAGERLAFKAYPTATNVKVLRTVVCTADMPSAEVQFAESRPGAHDAAASNGRTAASAHDVRPAA